MKTLLELNEISNTLRVDEKRAIEMYMQLNSTDKKFYADHIEDSELKHKFWDALEKYEIYPVDFVNFATVSRFFSGDRTTIRANRIPQIHKAKINELLAIIEKWQRSALK